MENLKYDFSIDLYTKEKFNIIFYRNKIKAERIKRNISPGVYFSEAAALYYKEIYNKEFEDVLNEFYDIPKCPVTNLPVKLKYSGVIKFQKFSRECSISDRNVWIEFNVPSKKAFTERMKIERRGAGNPAFGNPAWNKNLGLEDERVKASSIKRSITVNKFSQEKIEEIKAKQSKSAKKREIHGHTGILHSEETKQKLREKTLERIKNKRFPQTNTLPMKIFKELLLILKIEFEEEFKLKYWSFDFKIKDKNILIEIQGDYWHSNPLKFPNGPKTKGQKVNFLRDKKKREFVKKETNFELIEIWEYDIINNINKVEICLKELLK